MFNTSWTRTSSPLTFMDTYSERFDGKDWNPFADIKLGLDNMQSPRYEGLTGEELWNECVFFFANSTVKVEMQFVETFATLITRDTRKVPPNLQA